MKTTSRVYKAIDFNSSFEQLPSRQEPDKVIMVSPDYFDIVDIKNVHMIDQAGNLDRNLAIQQWNNLKSIYLELKEKGILSKVNVIEGSKNCEDMVFAANQSFPWQKNDEEKTVVLSKMRHESRQREVPAFRSFYQKEGYTVLELKKAGIFEGMGDFIPLPGKQLLFAGYGHRTEKQALEEISELLDLPVIELNLINEKFYHLDTCFIPLNKETLILYPEAFSPEDFRGLKKLFKNVLTIPKKEAENGFALNAHIINSLAGKVAVLQEGNTEMNRILEENGYNVYTTNTSEFIKSGGSVFCMKMMHY